MKSYLLILSLLCTFCLACQKEDSEPTNNSNTNNENDPDPQGGPSFIEATVNGESIRAEYHCPSENSLADCNYINESTDLIRMRMTVSDEDETGWNIEMFPKNIGSIELPHTIEVMSSGNPDNEQLTFKYYNGSWTGNNLYSYTNTPVEPGEITLTITSYEDRVIEGTFSGEIEKASDPNETVTFSEGSFRVELDLID